MRAVKEAAPEEGAGGLSWGAKLMPLQAVPQQWQTCAKWWSMYLRVQTWYQWHILPERSRAWRTARCSWVYYVLWNILIHTTVLCVVTDWSFIQKFFFYTDSSDSNVLFERKHCKFWYSQVNALQEICTTVNVTIKSNTYSMLAFLFFYSYIYYYLLLP